MFLTPLTPLTQSFKHPLCMSTGLWQYLYDLSLSLSQPDTYRHTVSLCPSLTVSLSIASLFTSIYTLLSPLQSLGGVFEM